jgi:hypothetical protein
LFIGIFRFFETFFKAGYGSFIAAGVRSYQDLTMEHLGKKFPRAGVTKSFEGEPKLLYASCERVILD